MFSFVPTARFSSLFILDFKKFFYLLTYYENENTWNEKSV